MIRIIIGGIGSCKSLLIVKMIRDKQEKCFGNFMLRQTPYYARIKTGDVLIKEKNSITVNWQHWKNMIKKHGGFHIFLDEMHNLMHSRRAMSRENIALSRWISQVRKITGENEKYDLVCVSQEVERIDVAVRDLCEHVIVCEKFESKKQFLNTPVYKHGRRTIMPLPITWGILTHFVGRGAVKRYQEYRLTGSRRMYNYKTQFIANLYFQYYDSYELITFGEDEYL